MSAAQSSYTPGQCTWYVSGVLSWIPAGLGNATDWIRNAQAKGFATGRTPQVGAAVVWPGSNNGGCAFGDGHVAVVTEVTDPLHFKISEMNGPSGPGVVDSRAIGPGCASTVEGFIYPPGGATSGATASERLSSNISGAGNAAAQGANALPPAGSDAAHALLQQINSGGLSNLNPFQAIADVIKAGLTVFIKIAEVGLGIALAGVGLYLLVKDTEFGAAIQSGAQSVGKVATEAAMA